MSPHAGSVERTAAGHARSARPRGCASPGAGAGPADTCTVWSGERDDDIAAAAAALSRGEPVAFPTETVYGLGAMSADDAMVARIFQAKGRPSDNPLIVHFADGHEGLRLLAAGGKVPVEATALAEAFWPGPLSICIRANTDNVCNTCRAGLDTVAVRVPDHPVALKLLRALDKKMGAATGVAAPSANASGRPSPTEALHVLQDLGHGGRIAGVVDGGRSCSVGIESTVVGDMPWPTPLAWRPQPQGFHPPLLTRTPSGRAHPAFAPRIRTLRPALPGFAKGSCQRLARVRSARTRALRASCPSLDIKCLDPPPLHRLLSVAHCNSAAGQNFGSRHLPRPEPARRRRLRWGGRGDGAGRRRACC